MTLYIKLDDGGYVLESIYADNGECPDGFIEAGEISGLLAPPELGARYHYPSLTWVAPQQIETLRARRWEAIKSARETHEFGGFSWDGSAFDSDPQAQARIQGGVQLATIAAAQSQSFSIDWTLADNTVRTLSGADMIAVGMTLAAHVQTVHAIARALRLQIEAATTLAEVEAVVWP